MLVICRFCFEGGIWALIPPDPGHCLLVTFMGLGYARNFIQHSILSILTDFLHFLRGSCYWGGVFGGMQIGKFRQLTT